MNQIKVELGPRLAAAITYADPDPIVLVIIIGFDYFLILLCLIFQVASARTPFCRASKGNECFRQ